MDDDEKIPLDETNKKDNSAEENVEECLKTEWATFTKSPCKNIQNNADDKNQSASLSANVNPNVPKVTDAFEHKCEICKTEIVLSSKDETTQKLANLLKYQRHLLLHTDQGLFDEIPLLDRYYCPKKSSQEHSKMSSVSPVSPHTKSGNKNVQCSYESDNRDHFLLHLSNHHQEFYPRLLRRLRETGDLPENTASLSDEYKQLKSIKRSLQNKKLQNLFNFKLPLTVNIAELCDEKHMYTMYEQKHFDIRV